MHKNDVPKNPELMLVRLNALLTSSIFHNVHLLLQFTKNWKILQKGKIRKYTEEYFSIKNFHPLYECFFYYPCTKCISGDIVYPITEILFEKVKN